VTELIRREVNDRVANKATLDAHIFDEAQKEVEDLMRDSVYVNFLNSDVYLSYIQVRCNDLINNLTALLKFFLCDSVNAKWSARFSSQWP